MRLKSLVFVLITLVTFLNYSIYKHMQSDSLLDRELYGTRLERNRRCR